MSHPDSVARHALNLVAWRAWSAPYPDPSDFAAFLRGAAPAPAVDAKPANSDVPPRLRRRCTFVSRMVLETAGALTAATPIDLERTHLLFGSRNSEINILRNLLNDIEDGEAVSPTAFGNSVHHTASGYFSLVAKHRGISRTISANDDTFTCCILDSLDLLRRAPDSQVLLVLAEEQPLAPFDQMLTCPPFPFAVALLLRAGDPADSGLQFRLPAEQPVAVGEEPTVFTFLRWWLGETPVLHLGGDFGGCTWYR